MELYWWADIDNRNPIYYDPIQANPDYLVIGPFAQVYGFYEEKVIEDRFVLEADIGGNQIYQIKNSQ